MEARTSSHTTPPQIPAPAAIFSADPSLMARLPESSFNSLSRHDQGAYLPFKNGRDNPVRFARIQEKRIPFKKEDGTTDYRHGGYRVYVELQCPRHDTWLPLSIGLIRATDRVMKTLTKQAKVEIDKAEAIRLKKERLKALEAQTDSP